MIDSDWTVADDVAAAAVASIVSLRSIQETYSDDVYGDTSGWSRFLISE